MTGRISSTGADELTQSNVVGVLWALVAVFLFALIFISGKLTGNVAYAGQIIWLRYVGGILTVCVWMYFGGLTKKHLRTGTLFTHFIRAAAGGGGGLAAIYAAANMPVADATAIGLLDGLFTVVLGIIVLKEVVSLKHWLASGLCFAGAFIVVFGKGTTLGIAGEVWFPASIALLGAMLVATESILIKLLTRAEYTVTILFYVNLFGAMIFLPIAALQWVDISYGLILIFLGLGPIAILGQYCNIKAYRFSDAAIIGPVRYSWIIFGALLGWILFSEVPNILFYWGGALILIGGGILARLRGQMKSRD